MFVFQALAVACTCSDEEKQMRENLILINKTMVRKLVIIPTYNEIENISRMIDTVMSLAGDFDMLVIDDGSPDGTAEVVERRRKEFADRLFLIRRVGKLGLGTAYLAGFKWALEHGYDYIFEMDCDFSHNPDDLQRLYEAAEAGADVVVHEGADDLDGEGIVLDIDGLERLVNEGVKGEGGDFLLQRPAQRRQADHHLL